MVFGHWGIIAIVAAGFLGWNWYQQWLLWDAATAHYVEPLKTNKELFDRAIQACEAEARKEDIIVLGGKGVWNPNHTTLERGTGLEADRSLAYKRDYKFHVYLRKSEPDFPHTDLICDYDTDSQRVLEVFVPDPTPWPIQ